MNSNIGSLIVIEGTDCSGKETQAKALVEKLIDNDIKVSHLQFPNYESPTGKIIGGPYLGKDYIGDTYFSEGAANVNPKVASLYFAADRLYNIQEIKDLLNSGIHVILDRYIYSNMGHQGGKLSTREERLAMYKWLWNLEVGMLDLPVPDIAIFLHMPYKFSVLLKEGREEKPDGHELSEEHLINAENAYIELAELYKFKTIKCYENNDVRSITDINNDLYNYIIDKLKP